MSQLPAPSVPPPKWYGPQDGLPMRVEYACHAAYACICSYMHTYAPAYPHLHMHAWHMHLGIYMHGMHAPTYACMACMACMHAYAGLIPCAPPPHIPQGGGRGMTMCEALTRWIL